jgi:hypothetical protein
MKSDLGVDFRDALVDFDTLMRPHESANVPARFCALVMSNLHPLRLRAVHLLQRVEAVDTYGRAFRRPLNDKAAVLRNYRYCIAFENDLYPGCVTEKAIDAWMASAIPLWLGSDPAGYLNVRCLVDLASLGSLSALVECVQELERDLNEWAAKFAEPFLQRAFDHHQVVNSLKEVLDG